MTNCGIIELNTILKINDHPTIIVLATEIFDLGFVGLYWTGQDMVE